jgi:hypothetical protein
MMGYIINKDPVYFETDVDGSGDSVNILMTGGLAAYTAETYPCIAKLSNEIDEDVTWITGHSLGGAAATLYKLVIDSPLAELVTFGAIPTKPIWTDNAKYFKWPDSTDPEEAAPRTDSIEGTRYFHKFDPATSYYMHMMTQKHEVKIAYMFFDTPDAECPDHGFLDMTTTQSVVKSNYDPSMYDLDSGEKTALKKHLYNFLCSESYVATNSVQMQPDYFGYMAAMNPVPCAEALVSQVWAYVQTLPYVSASVMPAEVWMPHEDFVQCSVSYAATMDAYTATYFASFMDDGGNNPIWTDSDKALDDVIVLVSFYAWFGLFWIHGSYPNYKMADVEAGYTQDNYDYSTPIGYDSDTGRAEDPMFELINNLQTNLPQLLDSDGEPVDDIEQVLKDWLGFDWDEGSGSGSGKF